MCPRVQSLGRDVSLIRPNDRPGFRIGTEPAKVLSVPQGLEDAAVVEEIRKVYVRSQPVLETDVDRVAIRGRGLHQKWRAPHGSMVVALPKGLNWLERLVITCPVPVLAKLGLASDGPLDHQAFGPGRQVAGDDDWTVDGYGSLGLAITGMEMRAPQVMVLVLVHPDRDPVEAADSWHRASLQLVASRNKT